MHQGGWSEEQTIYSYLGSMYVLLLVDNQNYYMFFYNLIWVLYNYLVSEENGLVFLLVVD